ncbi:MAG: hotdog fold thioesterase [Bacteroidota bacterium]|nr:hotdog fold thioesterase [Bacteroidota bacterium]MEC9065475.1 hotdog fold thioesterase [Bacteroidota bacterium]MED5269550.1 hotdog fold thioesterase [Bacteroidota bacterium]|tara:strand:+ start:331 stop:738 length:408 start_codon:yes stop_codon:yes gene_type:complete
MDKELLLSKVNARNQGTLSTKLGIEFTEVGDNYLIAKMNVTPDLHQPAGVLHGGATAALAETVGSAASAVFCKKDNQMLRGIELSINHVRGIESGEVFARADAIKLGSTMQLWKISITDKDGKDISFAKLTTLTL